MTAWRDELTDAQRSAWAAYAQASGYTIPGQPKAALGPTNAYLQFNLPRLLIDLARIDDPPPFFFRLPPPEALVFFTAGQFLFVSAAGQLPGAGESFLISLSIPFSAAANNPRIWFRQHFHILGPRSTSSSFPINPPHQVGATFQIHVRIFRDDALISLPQITTDVL